MSGVQLSTHVLDAALGRPATGVPVRWERRAADGSWTPVGTGTTDTDGRVASTAWLRQRAAGAIDGSVDGSAGTWHRLVFDVETWSSSAGTAVFFPEVTITFVADGRDRHHVPLLLSPFAYSTYRGS